MQQKRQQRQEGNDNEIYQMRSSWLRKEKHTKGRSGELLVELCSRKEMDLDCEEYGVERDMTRKKIMMMEDGKNDYVSHENRPLIEVLTRISSHWNRCFCFTFNHHNTSSNCG